MDYHPKLRLLISPTCVDSKTIFNHVTQKYDIVYCGIHDVNGDIYVYLHNRERMVPNVLKKILGDVIEILDISKYSSLAGNTLDSNGTILKHGGHKKKKITGNISVSTIQQKNPVLDLSKVQPRASKKARPDNCIVIHDDFYINKTSSEATPEMFHAVWSSMDGFWSPQMWVGPIKNLKGASARTSIKPQLIKELLEEQESSCRLCRTDVFMGTYSNSDVDHIIPLKHGGSCQKGNLQVLCVTCHRRKTALECKKVVTLMGSPDVKWEPEKVYMVNSHVHFVPDVVHSKNPKYALGIFGSRAGIFVLENT